MFTTEKGQLFQYPLKTCALGLAVLSLIFSTPGFCAPKPDNEAKAKQVLREAAEMPLPKESDQLGPHPDDPDYAKFKAQMEKIVAKERAQDAAHAGTKQRIKALDD